MSNEFQQRFEEAKAKLNDAQRLAVETIEGPVLTIAGPGTGKTQVLAVRIGEILTRQVGISPYNILCLTYTDAAAANMKKRLASFIGADAYKVHISTYHAFCAEVIKYRSHYFERKDGKTLIPVDEINYFEILRAFILNLDIDHPLKRTAGNLIQYYRDFKTLFGEMDKERFSPEFLEEKINAHIAHISSDTENSTYFYVTKAKQGQAKDALANAIDRFEKLISAVNLKPAFDEALLGGEGFYTYEQMILFVIDAFKKYPDLLADYQERFQYILVDEYQDTNNSQNELLFLLTSYWEQNPNLFAVGDDDQSIYRFQGANTENIKIFEHKFSQFLTRIRLDKNYRSSQHILDAAELFIQKNTDRLLPSKQLTAEVPSLQAEDNRVHVIRYGNTFEEEIGIVKKIKSLIASGVPASEIAILYKKHSHSDDLQKILKAFDVPFEFQASPDILKEKFIEQTIVILTYLCRESQYPNSRQDLLFKILHYDFFSIPISLIVALYEKNDRKKAPNLRSLLLEVSQKTFPEFEKEDIEKVKKLATTLENLLSKIHNVTVQVFVERVIYDLGIIQFAHRSEDKVFYLEQLYTFFAFIKNETLKHPFQSVQYFIERIEEYKNQKESLPVYRMIRTENSIKLMTVFASKGLEFEYVFMIKTTQDHWEKSRKPNNRFKLPDNVLHYQHTQTTDEDEKIEELRRLFYVGITRAKKKVFISYADLKPATKTANLQMSLLLSELIQTQKTNVQNMDELVTEKVALDDLDAGLFHVLLPPAIDKAEIELKNKAFVEKKLESFRLSASTLNQYLKCPIAFYYREILNIPTASTPDQGFGKAVHATLKSLYPNRISSRTEFLGKDEFVKAFETQLSKYKSFFTKDEFDTYLERGRYKLPLFYDHYIEEFKKERIVQTEYPTQVVINGVSLFGIFDKLVFKYNDVTIVDYKTGAYSKSKLQTDRLKPPSEKNEYGGDYWRQGAFYKILIDNTYLNRPDKKWKAEKVVFQYVEQEDGHFEQEEFVYTDEQINIVQQLISKTWDDIFALRFTEGCNKPDCEWCTFAKTSKISIEAIMNGNESQ